MNSLKALRKQIGITQVQAAKMCGVSRRTYQTYEEKGQINETYDELVNFLKENGINDKGPALWNIRYIKMMTSEIFAKYPQVECAYLFGSYANGEATMNSDVDILIVAPSLEGFDFGGLHHDLRTVLNKDVDLVKHTTLLKSERMLRDILKKGVKLYG